MLGTAGSITKSKDGSIVRTATEKELEGVNERQSIPRARVRADAAQRGAACEFDAHGYYDPTAKVIRVSRTVEVRRHDGL